MSPKVDMIYPAYVRGKKMSPMWMIYP